MKRLIPGVVAAMLLALMLGIAACGDDDNGGGGGENVDRNIGHVVPLTGDLADFGPPGRKAVDLAGKQIKEAIQKGGFDDKVAIRHADEETDPQAARKLIADGSTCLVGAWASSDAIPVTRSVAIREGVLQITPSATGVKLQIICEYRVLTTASRKPPLRTGKFLGFRREFLRRTSDAEVKVRRIWLLRTHSSPKRPHE